MLCLVGIHVGRINISIIRIPRLIPAAVEPPPPPPGSRFSAADQPAGEKFLEVTRTAPERGGGGARDMLTFLGIFKPGVKNFDRFDKVFCLPPTVSLHT